MKWDKDLFIEIKEMMEVIPPEAGIPNGLDKFYSNGCLKQPVIRRKNYITNEWTHLNMTRASRPLAPKVFPIEEKSCVFCPENIKKTPRHPKTGSDYIRIDGNPWKLRVFPNLYPWLIEHQNVVETPKHKVSIADSNPEEELLALTTIRDITGELEQRKTYPVVFRNHGWGASITHFHWQVGALPNMPNRIKEEVQIGEKFYKKYNKNIFVAIILSEKEKSIRVIDETDDLLIISPFAPRTAFEVWILFKKPYTTISDCSDSDLKNLAEKIHEILTKLYNLAKIDIVNIVIHQIPKFNKLSKYYRLHVEILPFKFLAGAERGFLEFAIEITPEKVAEILS